MADAKPVNPYAFWPFQGGGGKRITATSTTSSGEVPGTQAVKNLRLLVTNDGNVTAYVRFGQSTVTADTNCMALLPGTSQVFTAPFTGPGTLYFAAITVAGTTGVQVTAGEGA